VTAPTPARLREQLGRGPLTAPPEAGGRLLRQVVRFGLIGAASTLAYLLLFSLLRPSLGEQGANLVALLATAVANTAANRRLTFGVQGSAGGLRHQVQGLAVFALGLLLTSGSLALLHLASPVPASGVELAVLVAANLVATLVRFTLLRAWVFRVH
jgi:putative flippase GtrA